MKSTPKQSVIPLPADKADEFIRAIKMLVYSDDQGVIDEKRRVGIWRDAAVRLVYFIQSSAVNVE